MLKSGLTIFILCIHINVMPQSEFKKAETFSLNLLSGYQSIYNKDDINKSLIANNFTALATPSFSVGLELAVCGGKELLKAQFRFSGLFIKENVQESSLITTTAALQYGRDLLVKKEKTYLYPFIGIRMFDNSILGNSSDGKKMDAWKINFDFMAGIGLKQFLNYSLKGVFNNFDISSGISVPAINGRWKKEGAEYITGTFKIKPTWYITFTIGRAFRPAAYR